LRRGSTAWPERGRAACAALLVASIAALLAAAPSDARKVRVFAMGPKLHISWLESRESFRAKLFAVMDARERGPAAPPVQAGLDDAASHLLGPEDPARPVETARDLVLWPESLGLFAALTGERARAARESGSLEGAIGSLIAAYGPQNAYYAERFPGLTGRTPQTRLLALSLTDTFGRAVLEPAAEMADRYDVYLHMGVDLVQDWRIVCEDKESFQPLPGGVGCDLEDPQRVETLRDPLEPGRTYAYEATGDDPSVIALVFDPDGRLISKQVKTYITPVELGPAEDSLGLDLVPGHVSDGLGAVETPVGTLGFVTSKDAWMPDVVTKLDQRHVDLLVQPELFVGNYIQTTGTWNPDLLLASGYDDMLRHPSFEAMVLPELTGGIFSFYADHQQHIAIKPRTGREGLGYLVGQPPHRGLVQVAPWVVDDPVRPDEPFDERRRRLGLAGEDLKPGSGKRCEDPSRPGPCEDGHVESVLWRDIEVARAPRRRPFRGRRARTRFSPARAVSPSRYPQRNIETARRGRRILLAFEERRAGRDQVFLVRSEDGGRTWSRRVRPTGRPPGSTDEWWPSVALGQEGRATVTWMDRSSGRERVWFSQSADGGRTFGPPAAIDPDAPPQPAQWAPSAAYGPGDTVHVAWVDERATRADDGLAQAGLFYTRIRSGAPEPARRLDTGSPAPLARKLDNSWAPSVSTRGDHVLVAWLDFLNYDWDVFSRLSTDGGETFAEQETVNDTPPADEAINDSPQALIGASGPLVAWTDWRKDDETQTRPHTDYDIRVAVPGSGTSVRADNHGERQAAAFSPALCRGRGDDLLVAFQDAGRGVNTVRVATLAGGSRRGPARLADDAPRRGGNAWRPRLACWGRAVTAAWEDERDGPAQVYAARSLTSRLGR